MIMMTTFSVLIFTLIVLTAKPASSFSLRYPNPNFPAEAGYALVGDAHFHFGFGDYAVELNRPTPSSSGLLLRSKPFKCSSSTSISTNFTFEIGNGVALVIVPTVFPSKFIGKRSIGFSDEDQFLSIEFSRNACKIVSAGTRVSNVSKMNNVTNSGVRFSSWIDYRASLKRLDVRLSKLGDPRSVQPLISHHIDLGEMWKGDNVLLGLFSSTGNSEQITTVYSWKSKIEDVPKWLHSNPINPQDYSNVHGDMQTTKKKGCFLSGFIWAMGCGAMAALALFFVWSYLADWQKIRGDPIDLKYEKIDVHTGNNSEAAKK